MAFAMVKSKSPTGIGRMFRDCEGNSAYKLLQSLTDFGIPINLVVKNNFGRILFNWSLIWAKDTTRKQGKQVIRELLNQVDTTKNYEMFVCSLWNQIEKDGVMTENHVAFDLDDSHQDGKVLPNEAFRRWHIVKRYNYRAPTHIKYDQMEENYAQSDENYKELQFLDKKKEWVK